MNIETHDIKNAQGNGGFERRDIGVAGVIYFFLGLAAITVVIHLLLVGFYDFLDKRTSAEQAPLSPLVTNVPTDTRHIPNNYPDRAFPDPRLENDERNQLNQIRLNEEETLNSYGWIDEKSKTVRIPIERAMDLVAQRGLPVRSSIAPASAAPAQSAVTKKKGKKQ
jgi:hypothetical protein